MCALGSKRRCPRQSLTIAAHPSAEEGIDARARMRAVPVAVRGENFWSL